MVKIYFATNRNVTGKNDDPKFGNRFHRDGPQFYRVGFADVERISDDESQEYEVRNVRLAKESHTGTEDKGRLERGSHHVFQELRDAMRNDERDVIVYLHGFASTWDSALQRAAQLSENYTITRADGSSYAPYVFAFLWPSDGKVVPAWKYFSDRDDAEASGKAMARALLRLVDFLQKEAEEDSDAARNCARRLHLVAHSMGNFALRHAVQALRGIVGDNALRPIFANVFLMAADEDEDALELQNSHKLGLLPKLARRVHVYHSADDLALVVSDTTKLNPDRLGFNGPRTFSGLSTRITAVDCGDVDFTSVLDGNHQYYRAHPVVLRDVRAVLSGLQRPELIDGREVIEPGRRYRLDG